MLRGDYDGAEAALSHAVSTSPRTDTAYGRSVNNLGVLAELRGDRRKAEALYADAQRAFADSPARERRVVETNLTRIRGAR
jgi:Flp pilus assembly protein TadD